MTDIGRATFLTMAVFALQPLGFGAWLAMLPIVKADLGLDKAQFAIALLGGPIAVIPTLQIASRVLQRFGPRRIMMLMFPLNGLLIALPFFAYSQLTLFCALFGVGIGIAFMQVSLNVYAGRLEKSLDAIVMNRCHGFWAIGLMVGSLIASLLLFWPPVNVLLLISISSGLIGAGTARLLPQFGEDDEKRAAKRRRLNEIPPALFLIALMALSVSMTEGAMADWAAIYLSERLAEGSPYIGMGVSIYAGCLAAGRLIGDSVNRAMGPVRLARLAIAIALVGLSLLVAPLHVGFAFVGFALVGLGASVGFPLAISAAASFSDTYEGANIAILSSIAICGFLVGPPLIGIIAEASSLSLGLAALIPGLLFGIIVASHLKRP